MYVSGCTHVLIVEGCCCVDVLEQELLTGTIQVFASVIHRAGSASGYTHTFSSTCYEMMCRTCCLSMLFPTRCPQGMFCSYIIHRSRKRSVHTLTIPVWYIHHHNQICSAQRCVVCSMGNIEGVMNHLLHCYT